MNAIQVAVYVVVVEVMLAIGVLATWAVAAR